MLNAKLIALSNIRVLRKHNPYRKNYTVYVLHSYVTCQMHAAI